MVDSSACHRGRIRRHYHLGTPPVHAADLLPTLRNVYADRPDKLLNVAGHRTARYQSVLDAMDAARSAGVTVIAIPPSESYEPR